MRSGEWIAIATVVAPHGIRGEVRCRPLSDHPERFQAGVVVRRFDETRKTLTEHVIEEVRWFKGHVILRLSGIATRDEAEAMRGSDLLVAVSERYRLPEGHYYVDDLRGMEVCTVSGRLLGIVEEVIPNPANDLLQVATDAGVRILIPLVRAFVTIDQDAGRIVVDPIPGLLPEEVLDAD